MLLWVLYAFSNDQICVKSLVSVSTFHRWQKYMMLYFYQISPKSPFKKKHKVDVIAISQNTPFLKKFAIIYPKPNICNKNLSDMLNILLI